MRTNCECHKGPRSDVKSFASAVEIIAKLAFAVILVSKSVGLLAP